MNDLGPVYGFQWRHFNAEYNDMHADYAVKADQLAEVIHKIKNNPNDLIYSFNRVDPAALKEMALRQFPLFSGQFYVANDIELPPYQRQRWRD